jgi:RNAse (barnase) inhibitor barstar
MNHDPFELGLHDLNNAGVYAIGNGDVGPLSAAMRDAGLRVLQVDLDGCHDKRTLLKRLGTQLDFPSTFGGNWDALQDCLGDLQWLQSPGGYAVFLSDADALRNDAGADFDTLLDVLDEASKAWAKDDVPFWAFVALQDVETPHP